MSDRQARRDRLDRILVGRGLAENRSRAQALILAGRVFCGERRLDKPGTQHPVDLPLAIRPGRRWVSRGGFKLAAGLRAFRVEVSQRDCIDVGASTGGFTEVLLDCGARRVIALDVGRGQLDWSLRNDDRVFALEGVNARYLAANDLPFPPSLAVVDVAFISLELVLSPVVACLDTALRAAEVVALIKPQFEAGRGQVGRGGVVRDPAQHRAVLRRLIDHCRERGWGVAGLCASPLAGADGNREFLVHLLPAGAGLSAAELDRAVRAALGSVSDSETSA